MNNESDTVEEIQLYEVWIYREDLHKFLDVVQSFECGFGLRCNRNLHTYLQYCIRMHDYEVTHLALAIAEFSVTPMYNGKFMDRDPTRLRNKPMIL